MIRFFVIYFILIAVGISVLELSIFEGFYQNFGELIAMLSGAIIHLFDKNVVIDHAILKHAIDGFALEVTRDCLAVETTLLFCAAILAWKTTWQQKLLWLLPSILLLQVVNIVRLITLLYIGKWYPDNFNLIHENLWPLAFVLMVLILFAHWVKYLENRFI